MQAQYVNYSVVNNEVLWFISKVLTSWSNSSTFDSNIRNSSFNWLIVSPSDGSTINDSSIGGCWHERINKAKSSVESLLPKNGFYQIWKA